MKPQGLIPTAAPEPPREERDVQAPLIVRVALVLVLGIGAVLTICGVLFAQWDHTYANRTSEAAPTVLSSDLPPTPRLQIAPARDLRQVRVEEDSHIARYAWTDRARGVAQIPIERAMDLWVRQEGPASASLPAVSTNATPAGVTELQMRQNKAQEAAHAP